jgi:hypothetical protein
VRAIEGFGPDYWSARIFSSACRVDESCLETTEVSDKIEKSDGAPTIDPKPSYEISSERHAHHNALNTAQQYTDEALKAEADAYIVRVGRVFHAARVGWETAKLQTCPFCFSTLGNVSWPGEPDHMEDRKLFSDLGRWGYERYYGLGGK